MGGVHGERGEDGEDLLGEISGQPYLLGLVQIRPTDDRDAFGGKGGKHCLEKDLGLATCEFLCARRDQCELRPRRQPVGRPYRQPCFCAAFEAGDTNHVELVEIGREDRQELRSFEKRDRLVLGEGEYARIEIEPAQFAVEVSVGREPIRTQARCSAAAGGAAGVAVPRTDRETARAGTASSDSTFESVVSPWVTTSLLQEHHGSVTQWTPDDRSGSANPIRSRTRLVAAPVPSRTAASRSPMVSTSKRSPSRGSLSAVARIGRAVARSRRRTSARVNDPVCTGTALPFRRRCDPRRSLGRTAVLR